MQMMQGAGGMGAMGAGAGAGAGTGAAGAGGAAQPNPFANMGMMGGMNPQMMAAMGGAGAPAQTDARPPREKFATQLQQIKEMGFNDEDAILQILEQTGGNVQLALEKLF